MRNSYVAIEIRRVRPKAPMPYQRCVKFRAPGTAIISTTPLINQGLRTARPLETVSNAHDVSRIFFISSSTDPLISEYMIYLDPFGSLVDLSFGDFFRASCFSSTALSSSFTFSFYGFCGVENFYSYADC